jgi:hypothetical protein
MQAANQRRQRGRYPKLVRRARHRPGYLSRSSSE